MVNDTELPFHRIVQHNIEHSDLNDTNLENTASMLIRIAWPKDLVIQRRIDALCELILRPKQPQKRQIRSRKRKPLSNDESGFPSTIDSSITRAPMTSSSIITPPPHVANRQYLSDVATDSEEEDEEDDNDDTNRLKKARYEYPSQSLPRVPTKPLKSQGVRPPVLPMDPMARSTIMSTVDSYESANNTPSTNLDEDEEMEEGELGYSDNEEEQSHYGPSFY